MEELEFKPRCPKFRIRVLSTALLLRFLWLRCMKTEFWTEFWVWLGDRNSTDRAISCTLDIITETEAPQFSLKENISVRAHSLQQAGQCWISQMRYCLESFQSVLDPVARDYSQVQNCMHKQLQRQFTACELNQPIVSTISCSLLILKELGRWLPLQLASCGQLGLLVPFCTLKYGMWRSGPHPRT